MKRNEYEIYSSKVKNDKNIAILSDLHISENFSNKKLEEVLYTLEGINPTHIVIPGDLYNVDMNTIFKDKVTDFIKQVSTIADIFYVKGNTEDMGSILNMSILPCGLEDNKCFHTLGEKEIIVETNDINFTAIKFPVNFYQNTDDKKIIELLKKYSEYLVKLSNQCQGNNFNVLLCHDPIICDALKILEVINGYSLNFDLIISGHNHGGMFPKKIKPIIKILGNDETIYYPTYTSGIHKCGNNGLMIVSEGITKYHSEMGILENLERFHDGTIENVRVLKK